jgi:hypothetical protein
VIAIEVIGFQEEENASAGLIADSGFLFRASRAREQQRRAAFARRFDNDPTLRLAHVDILDKFEAKAAREPVDGFVVIANDKGKLGDTHQESP